MRLLLVEDDEVDRLAVKRALNSAGIQADVDEAATGEEAMRLVARHEYDCILLDYYLPGCDGLQMLCAIRAALLPTPIIALTGRGGEDFAVELMKAGATDYLSKQALTPDRLGRSLRYAIAMGGADAARRQALEREKAAREEAQAANRAKDEFLATLSHELRTPLNAILGWARLLASGTLDQTTTSRAIEIIDRNARLQAQLIEDLLDVSRIVTGKLRLDIRQALVSSIVAAAVEALRPAVEGKRIALTVRPPEQERPIMCDPARIEQIVWNLLSNAIKFTPEGGAVTIACEHLDGRMRVRVTDSGVGINAEFLPHVFDRFRQAEGAVTRTHGGLGIGLSIVRHLVEAHGGDIVADSEGEGRGATFTVSLPLTQPTAALATSSAAGVVTPESSQ